MTDKIIHKVGLGVVVVIYALALAERRRRRIPLSRPEMGHLAVACAVILVIVPNAFELPNIWAVPFFVVAAGLFVFAFRRLATSATSPPPDK